MRKTLELCPEFLSGIGLLSFLKGLFCTACIFTNATTQTPQHGPLTRKVQQLEASALFACPTWLLPPSRKEFGGQTLEPTRRSGGFQVLVVWPVKKKGATPTLGFPPALVVIIFLSIHLHPSLLIRVSVLQHSSS